MSHGSRQLRRQVRSSMPVGRDPAVSAPQRWSEWRPVRRLPANVKSDYLSGGQVAHLDPGHQYPTASRLPTRPEGGQHGETTE